MRMRKKPNLVPRMERCAATLITDPEALSPRLKKFRMPWSSAWSV